MGVALALGDDGKFTLYWSGKEQSSSESLNEEQAREQLAKGGLPRGAIDFLNAAAKKG